MAFRTSRTFTVRGRPPRLAGGISEPTSAHSASVKSLSYLRPRRSAAARCSGFHMRHLSPTQVPHKESQPIRPTQLLSGSALRRSTWRWRPPGSIRSRFVHRPRLLTDNGASYIAGDLAEWLDGRSIEHIRGAPYHPQTQGKSWHQTLKNRVLLENYYLPGALE